MSTCTRDFPGRPECAAEVRRWAARYLADCPATSDVELLLTELFTNAIKYSKSGQMAGTVRVRIAIAAGAFIRCEVRDQGPALSTAAAFRHGPGSADAVPGPGELAEAGRGLLLVRELAGECGADGRGLHWFRLPWFPAPGPAPAAEPEPWAARWLTVMERAGWRCECAGQCGRAGHRCPIGHAPGYPLHVVPVVPAGDAAAAALPADALVALCGSCRAGADRAAGRVAAAAQDGALFELPSGGGRGAPGLPGP